MMLCIAVFGPTASGKSSLGMRLATELNGEIVSADSMQIYKHLDVGTAKPSKEEQLAVPHRMIDICDPLESFSVYDYKTRAELEIKSIFSQNHLPIVLGGTGLYLDALFYNTEFGNFEIKPEIHAELTKQSEDGKNEQLLSHLSQIDPETARKLHEKDSKRIIRALEVYYSTGKTLSEYQEESQKNPGEFSFVKLNLVYQDRQTLYDRINKRVDLMLEDGLLEETEKLLRAGYLRGTTAAQAIGYKELIPYFENSASLEDCINLLKQKTRNYAKRQITWFRRYTDAHAIVMDGDADPFESALSIIGKYVR